MTLLLCHKCWLYIEPQKMILIKHDLICVDCASIQRERISKGNNRQFITINQEAISFDSGLVSHCLALAGRSAR